jgi:hypothetical protein
LISRAPAWRWVTWAAVAGERVGQATVQAARVPHATLLALALALALALCACGSIHRVPDADARADALASARPAHAPVRTAAAPARLPLSAGEASARSGLAAAVLAAQRTYNRETKGSKLRQETARIAADAILLGALARGDLAGARAQAQARLLSPANHFAHVTRISVVHGARMLVNATLNSDGTYVVAPARRELALHGRRVGTLLVSIQDVTGFVKLVRRRTGAEVVARGGSGQVRASLPSAASARLPASGDVRIAGRNYLVRSFAELGWGGEPLTVWVLVAR